MILFLKFENVFFQSTELFSILEVAPIFFNPLPCLTAASERTVLDNCPADVIMPCLMIHFALG